MTPQTENRPTRPNIVVIQADQMAPQALGAYGDAAAKTPHMDEIAAEGAVFERAYCNTPLCAPSRASMMTGRLPSEIGCFDNGDDFASSEPTFAHRLRAVGYHTALIGRMHFIGPDQEHGFEQRLTTDVYPADLDMVPDWNRRLDDRLQWYHDADSVFTAGVSKATVQQDFDDEVGFRARRAYYAAVSYIDDHVGRIRARLAELGLAENTVVIVTSDHGDMLGEKGLWYKMSPYEQSARVPLMITGPQALIPRGRYANPVSLIDLMPTLVELAGAGEVPESTGRSLLESARRETSGEAGPGDRDVVIEYLAEGTLRPQLTLVRGELKYVVCPGDPEQLFDLGVDPDELINRAADAEYAEQVTALRGALDERYDLEALEAKVLASQSSRRLVQTALAQGHVRHWDFIPDPEQRYVRGDFWNALGYGKIADPSR